VRGLRQAGLLERLAHVDPRAATEEELLLCHTPEYLRTAKHDVLSGRPSLTTGRYRHHAEFLGRRGAGRGGVLNAVDAVATARRATPSARCGRRPPCHRRPRHGILLFNNRGSRGPLAQRRHGLGRVLIVDWDVHHGNGTEDIFYATPRSFTSVRTSAAVPRDGRADETARVQALGPP